MAATSVQRCVQHFCCALRAKHVSDPKKNKKNQLMTDAFVWHGMVIKKKWWRPLVWVRRPRCVAVRMAAVAAGVRQREVGARQQGRFRFAVPPDRSNRLPPRVQGGL